MGAEKKIDFEKIVNREEAITHLEKILEGLRSGNVKLEHGNQTAEISTSGDLKLSVYVKSSGEKETLAIKMKWRRGGDAVKGESLSIDPS